jgi:hypothetical protein
MIPHLSWPAGVRATQVGVERNRSKVESQREVLNLREASPRWPAFAGHDNLGLECVL